MNKLILIFILPLLLISANTVNAADRQNRLGLGMSNQLANDIPSISGKLQISKSLAVGALFGFSTNIENRGFGVGVKIYQIIFEEPQLNVFLGGLGSLIYTKSTLQNFMGFQFDFTVGSEFHLTGLDSIGFSFECGLSINKKSSFSFETIGFNFVTAAVHFYI